MCNGVPLSESVLRRNGKCCGNECENCPYFPTHCTGSKLLMDFVSLECTLPCDVSTINSGLCECYNDSYDYQEKCRKE